MVWWRRLPLKAFLSPGGRQVYEWTGPSRDLVHVRHLRRRAPGDSGSALLRGGDVGPRVVPPRGAAPAAARGGRTSGRPCARRRASLASRACAARRRSSRGARLAALDPEGGAELGAVVGGERVAYPGLGRGGKGAPEGKDKKGALARGRRHRIYQACGVHEAVGRPPRSILNLILLTPGFRSAWRLWTKCLSFRRAFDRSHGLEEVPAADRLGRRRRPCCTVRTQDVHRHTKGASG